MHEKKIVLSKHSIMITTQTKVMKKATA